MRGFAAIVVGTQLIAGCMTTHREFDSVYPLIDSETTYQRLVLDSEFDAVDDIDVLALSDGIVEFMEREVRRGPDSWRRLESLTRLFTRKGELGMEYDVAATLTAREAFAERRGNCLSYTHLFIAMARASGMRVRYQEVLSAQQWDAIGDFVVLNKHIAVYGSTSDRGSFAVDFGVIMDPKRRFGRLVSDERARAQHFNNLGADALTTGDPVAGIRNFNRALLIDRGLSYVWTNLGTTYSRMKRYQEAEWAFRESMRLVPYDVSTINQTATLYARLGRDDLAAGYREMSLRERQRNPYYLFQEGVDAMSRGDLEIAIDNLRLAARREPEEMHFHLQLGKAYVLNQNPREAKKSLVLAEQLSTTASDQDAVQAMIEDLCSNYLECPDRGLVEAPEQPAVIRSSTPGEWPWG